MLTYEVTAGSMASKARKAAFISGARVRVAKDAGRTGAMTGAKADEVIAVMVSMIARRAGVRESVRTLPQLFLNFSPDETPDGRTRTTCMHSSTTPNTNTKHTLYVSACTQGTYRT